jgi:hypothetical protein
MDQVVPTSHKLIGGPNAGWEHILGVIIRQGSYNKFGIDEQASPVLLEHAVK